MAWVETASLSFVARHESRDAHAAQEVLDDLERFRVELEELFGAAPGEVAVVMHARSLALDLAAPWLPLARLLSAPAGRRYFVGSFARGEIHVLAPTALERRASAVPGSREVLVRSPRHEYAHLVVGAANPSLPPPFSPSALRAYVDMAWLSEGSATFFAGQVPHMRGAIARRLREGRRPRFPPKARDAWVLGGTVFALLEREVGIRACVELARAPAGAGDRRAIERAFDRPAPRVERAWSDYLAALGPA